MRNKIHIVANIDNAILAISNLYDITIFRNFVDWTNEINKTPTILTNVIITEDLMPFTSNNMDSLFKVLNMSFFRLNDKIIYLVRADETKNRVLDFLSSREMTKKIIVVKNACDYQGILSVINGTGRSAKEGESYVVSYRVRADEYARMQNVKKYDTDNSERYLSDDELVSEDTTLTYQEPELLPSHTDLTLVPISGDDPSRTFFSVIAAQYLSLCGKTVIIEQDLEYHILTNAMHEIKMSFEYIDYSEFSSDVNAAIRKARSTSKNLILIGCKERYPAITYDFIQMLCLSQLRGYVDFFITNVEISRLSSTTGGIVVIENQMPSILKAVNKMPSDLDCKQFVYAIVSYSLNHDLALPKAQVSDIITELLGESVKIESYRFDGLSLSKGGLNDLQVLFGRKRRGQVKRLRSTSQS